MNCEKQQIDINLISHTATFLSFILWQICYVLISEMVDKSCKIWPSAFIHNCFLALFSLHLAHFKVKSCSWFNEVLLTQMTLQWRHNGRNSISNHQPHDCLFNYIFTHWSKKTSKLHVTDLCVGNSPVNYPHKGPVTQKLFPYDHVIMVVTLLFHISHIIVGSIGVRNDPMSHDQSTIAMLLIAI